MLNSLDAVDFYGDNEQVEHRHILYCEPLTTRSERHDWMIQPHRHRDLHQIFFVVKGGGQVQLDEQQLSVSAPVLLSIPEGHMHGFQWEPGSEGFVLSIVSAAISEISPGAYQAAFQEGAILQEIPAQTCEDLQLICKQLKREADGHGQFEEQMTIALLRQMVVHIARGTSQHEDVPGQYSKAERKFLQFKALIAQFGTTHHQVGWYAGKIGVSAAHLNQLCQQHASANALSMIHRHLLVEAKRHLMFADFSITSIAYRIGFKDPAHFTKFFTKKAGLSPLKFRQETRDKASPETA